ncbi:hypothetical protein RB594_004088 [Gaeumannomyces avenae]
MSDEKVAKVDEGALPTYGGKSEDVGAVDHAAPHREENWYTRNGLNFESFKKRSMGESIVELDRTMKARHLHMIAIGGSIGAGFFVGSGSALTKGGPGSLIIDFAIIGIMMFNVVYALGELAVMYPVSGSFYTYSVRFIDPSWGFAMGWNYVLQWACVLPLELSVCGLTLGYWPATKNVSLAVWIIVFWVAIVIINMFGTLGYAEEEFWSSVLKLSAIVIFMIIAVVLVCGGGPAGGNYDQYHGTRYWENPGAFQNGFRGFCGVFVTAAFSFSGTELVGLAAAEAKNPVRALPGAIKQVFWRITLFYILGLFFVGLLISSKDELLLNASDPYAEGTSPFVLAGKYAGLVGYDHFMNVIILVSVLSIGVSCVYGGSRTLTALAQQGYAPRVFTYVDKSGRPLYSVLVHIACGALAFLTLNKGANAVFQWLLSLSGLAALFTWGSICLAHIRFRAAWKHNGRTLDEIPFKAFFGVYGSWVGLILCVLVLIASLYSAICPVGSDFNDAEGFFKEWLTVPVILFFWACGYLWKREGGLRIDQIDIDTGRRELDWDEINAFKAELAAMPAWKRNLRKIFY